MNPLHREAHLERVGRHYNKQVILGLPFRMWRMRIRACGALKAATDRISALEKCAPEVRSHVHLMS